MAFGIPTFRLLACGLLICAGAAQAERSEAIRIDLAPDATPVQLEQQRKQLEAAISDTDDYAELSASDRKQVRDSLDGMAGQIEAAGSLAALPDADRSALLADQEEVNEVLEAARGESRLICKREKEIGSNFRRSVCMTVAQRRRMSEQGKLFSLPQS